MLRMAVISSVFLAACDVGAIPGIGPDSGGGGGGDGSGSNPDDVCVAAVTPAAAKHAHADDGSSKKGQACTAAGCHLIASPGAGAPGFSFGGTVFTASDGVTPKPGATVKVIAGGTTYSAVADEDGNFYSTQTVTLPGKTLATSCPTLTPMVSQIQASGGGNCNNCHQTGGTTTPIYVQ